MYLVSLDFYKGPITDDLMKIFYDVPLLWKEVTDRKHNVHEEYDTGQGLEKDFSTCSDQVV